MRKIFLLLFLAALPLFSTFSAAENADPTLSALYSKYAGVMFGTVVSESESRSVWTPGVRLANGDMLVSTARFSVGSAKAVRVRQGRIQGRAAVKAVNQLANLATLSTSVPGTGMSFSFDAELKVGERYYALAVLPPDTGFRCEVRPFTVTAVVDFPSGKVYTTDLPHDDATVVGVPVFNSALKPVGYVNVLRADQTETPVVFPSAYVRKAVAAAMDPRDTNLKRCWFGAFTRELTQVWCDKLNFPKELQGALIEDVVPGSPAAAAGLKSMDVVTAVNGTPIAGVDAEDLDDYFAANFRPSQTVKIMVFRAGEFIEMSVKLEERPTPPRDAPKFTDDEIGVTVRELTTYSRLEMGLEMDAAGVEVAEVEDRKEFQLAVRKALGASFDYTRPFLITAADGAPVSSVEDFQKALEKARKSGAKYVMFFIRYNKERERGCLNTAFLKVELR